MTLRPYQQIASDKAVDYLLGRSLGGGLIVLPTGSGKSLVVADIAKRLRVPVLVFCPSVEILKQNYSKMEAIWAGGSTMYSASVGMKAISMVTFATIGSVMPHISDFDVFKYIIIDEAHGVNASGGMYEKFIHWRADRKVLGLTATPFRLYPAGEGLSMLKFLTRTRPRIFNRMVYCVQVKELESAGYLSVPKYYDLTCIDLRNVKTNSTGADYDERSLVAEYERSDFYSKLCYTVLRVLHPKDGSERNGILVFTRFLKEADKLVTELRMHGISASVVSGKTPKKERERLVDDFRAGKVRVVANVGVFLTGFDYPGLDTVIFARPTKSLSVWYQGVGRVLRPFNKESWVIDLCGTFRRFGKVGDLVVDTEKEGSDRWCVRRKGRQLTNILY